jgi:hypothetical protein
MLPLPMTPRDFNDLVISKALGMLSLPHLDSPAARVLLTAIALQESGLRIRYQDLGGGNKGAARGLLQFERGSMAEGGGVWGVYRHRASTEGVRLLCRACDCSFDPWAIWAQLEHDDALSAGLGRLLLWTDRAPLPALSDVEGAWAYYLRTWNPGKPRPDAWSKNYAAALVAVVRSPA